MVYPVMKRNMRKNDRSRRFQKRWRKSRYVVPRYRKIANQIYPFKRTYEVGNYVSGSGLVNFGYYFQLDNLPTYTEYTTLFDSYKVKMVVLKVWSGIDSNDANGTTATSCGYLHHVHDYNDSNTLSSLDEYYQYSSYKCVPLNKAHGHVIILYPKLSVQYYKSALTTGYGTTSSKWLDLTSSGTGIPHFGLKYGFEWGSGPAKNYRVTATVYFLCKNGR